MLQTSRGILGRQRTGTQSILLFRLLLETIQAEIPLEMSITAFVLFFLELKVKNFGRAGRTKYTHLVDQDTTAFDAAWTSNDPLATKFQMSHGGGFKEVFEKPTSRKTTK